MGRVQTSGIANYTILRANVRKDQFRVNTGESQWLAEPISSN